MAEYHSPIYTLEQKLQERKERVASLKRQIEQQNEVFKELNKDLNAAIRQEEIYQEAIDIIKEDMAAKENDERRNQE